MDFLSNELSGNNTRYHMAFIDKEPVAFMKLNLSSNLPGLDVEKGMKLDKIYILRHFKGLRIGKRLLDVAFEIALQQKKEICWLAVIDTNREAISFYEKAGF
ncbi:MAG: GNAT family N-acetyltransferase [Ginsengibacter sp.]